MDFRIGAETSPMPPVDGRGEGAAGEQLAWRFEGFEFDLRRGELVGPDGATIALRPKAEALLQHFLAGSGRLFSREDLIAAVWPATIVTDDSLVQCVVELRTALGDRAQRLIRTVPRRGYRLEATVVPVFAPAAASVETAAPAAPGRAAVRPPDAPVVRRPRVTTSSLAAMALSLGVVSIVATAWQFRHEVPPVHIDDEIAARATVAIMPFAAPAERSGLRTLADTMADEVAAQLSTRIGMRAIGRTATSASGGATPPLDELRSRFKASHVLTGRVAALGDGGGISVDVQLASVPDGAVIWARRFEGIEARGAALAADVGQQVANAMRNRSLRIEVGSENGSADGIGPADLTLLGWRDLDRRKSLEDVWRARSRFETALRHDPQSVIATNGLAATYLIERRDPSNRLTAAQIADYERRIERARALAPEDATALLLWGDMQIARGRADLALPALEKANRLVPSYPMGYMLVSRALMMLGRADEVPAKLERAVELGAGDARKTSGAYSIAAEAALMLGDDVRAHDLAGRSIAALPSNADAHATLAALDALAGRHAEAADELAAFVRLSPAATVGRFDELRPSSHPVYRVQRERLYDGLRKAGLPER